jgi:creatinine amidohydrolase
VSPELRLERLTWPDVEAALARGVRTAVLPCGAIEQHGPHLPLRVDAEHAAALGVEVARRLGDALVAPVVRVGCSDHHMDFPGTLSLRRETFEAVHVDLCHALAHHGFTRVCCFSAHGGNFGPLADIAGRLDEAAGPGCRVDVFSDLMRFLGVWRDVLEEAGPGLGARVGGHADVAESSIALALAPEEVHPERAEPGVLAGLDPALVERTIREGFRATTPNGVLGDPTGMDAALGRRLIESMAEMLAEHFRDEEGR